MASSYSVLVDCTPGVECGVDLKDALLRGTGSGTVIELSSTVKESKAKIWGASSGSCSLPSGSRGLLRRRERTCSSL